MNQTAITWHLRKQVEVIVCPTYLHLRRFPESQKKKYKDKININN